MTFVKYAKLCNVIIICYYLVVGFVQQEEILQVSGVVMMNYIELTCEFMIAFVSVKITKTKLF